MHLTVQQLSSTLDGALTGPSLELVVRHLAVCHECRDHQARLAKHDDALRRLLARDPDDLFLDDLTRRTEALVIALARGLPPPVMVTSVPLLHEEDPYAPAEPPPGPPRPEFGRSGELAKEAGYGRIGAKPSSSPHAPPSDPGEAQRLLDALAAGGGGDFTELTAQGPPDGGRVDGPVFDLPDWIKAHQKSAPKVKGPRQVQKIDLFFQELDAELANLPPDAVDEVFRREPEAAPEAAPEDVIAPEPERELELPDPGAGWNREAVESTAWAIADLEQQSPAPPWSPEACAPVFEGDAREAPRRRARRPRGHEGAMVFALTSVSGLLMIVLALQLFPATPSRPRPGRGAGTAALQLPQVEFVRHDSAESEPEPPTSEVRNASVPPLLEQVLPPLQQPDTTADATPSDAPAETRASVLTHVPPAPVRQAAPRRSPAPSKATTSSRRGVTPAQTAVPVAASAADEGDWPLLCGLVEDADGLPVPGARVSVSDLSFAIRTDARGRFCLSAPPGAHTLWIEAAGSPAQRENATFAAGSADLRIRLRGR